MKLSIKISCDLRIRYLRLNFLTCYKKYIIDCYKIYKENFFPAVIPSASSHSVPNSLSVDALSTEPFPNSSFLSGLNLPGITR